MKDPDSDVSNRKHFSKTHIIKGLTSGDRSGKTMQMYVNKNIVWKRMYKELENRH